MRTIRIVILAAIAALLVPVDSTRGHVPLRESDGTIVKWDLDVPGQPNVVSGRITYYLSPLGSEDVPLSGLDELVAVRRAFDTWESVGTCRLAFLPDQSRLALKQSATDRINLIEWESGAIDPFTLALTFPFSQNGVLTDADLILNDDYRWETSTPGVDPWNPGSDDTGEPLGPAADVQAVVTHEIGHMIGLDHVPLAQSTMHFELPLGAISARSLEPDDIAGITSIYPNDRPRYELGSIRGRVSVRGKGDERGVHVVAWDLFRRMPAASAVSVKDGEYEISGLPPGQYRAFALPLRAVGAMVPYWYSSRTDFRGRAYGANGRNPGRPGLVKVKSGFTTYGVDFPDLDVEDEPNEPNDGPETAVALRINEVAVGIAESVTDEDWYAFPGSAGDHISIHLDARHLGADTNVVLELLGADGETSLGRSQDIRPALFVENRTGIEGIDTDARIENLTLPADETYFVRVSFSPNSSVGTPQSFYVLSLFSNALAPDDVASVVRVWPPAIPADGSYTATVTIEPRNLYGDLLAPGLEVEVIGEGRGTIGPVANLGDGTYSAVVTAPVEPGAESLTVRLRSGTGRAVIDGAVTIDYLGPPGAAKSEFFVAPHRLEPDGESTAVLVLRARDSRGAAYGPGLPVAFEFADQPDGELGEVRDEGDGSYSAVVTAPTANASDEFRATIAGLAVPVRADVRYGFNLSEVIDESLGAIAILFSHSEMPRPCFRLLQKAVAKLQGARARLRDDDPRQDRDAVSLVSTAAKLVERAERRAQGLVVFPSLAFELAEAARRYVAEVLDAIRFNPPDPGGEKVLTKAKERLKGGEERIEEGKYDKALRKIARALKVATPLR